MATTTSSVLAAALRTTVRKQLLENLRAELVWANPALADEGSFDSGSDTIVFGKIPDLSVATTPLTEGTNPTAGALSLSTVTLSTAQYVNDLALAA